MCLGIPARIVAIVDKDNLLANVAVSGIQRQINIACIASDESDLDKLIGQWVLVHVGFAMCVIDEAQAQQTLQALQSMQALEHEIDDFSHIGNAGEHPLKEEQK